MRNFLLLNLFILLSIFFFGCIQENTVPATKYDLPSKNHDLSYIPFDTKLDNPNFRICDSTTINSGRNRLRYIGGADKLRKDIFANYSVKPEHETFSGYIVIRLLVNCEGKSGRYRAQALNLDFSPLSASSDLIDDSIELIKGLDNWTKLSGNEGKEYSKFINLKINNGKIQHVLL